MEDNNQTLEETIALFQLQQHMNSTLDVSVPNMKDVTEEELMQAEQMKLKNDILLQGIHGTILEMLPNG